MKLAICPVCWHEETMRSERNKREPVRDGVATMLWQRPHGGACGQQVTRTSGGYWRCSICEVTLTPHEAGVLLDAVLRISDPHCDSIRDEMHEDARVAFAGGPT